MLCCNFFCPAHRLRQNAKMSESVPMSVTFCSNFLCSQNIRRDKLAADRCNAWLYVKPQMHMAVDRESAEAMGTKGAAKEMGMISLMCELKIDAGRVQRHSGLLFSGVTSSSSDGAKLVLLHPLSVFTFSSPSQLHVCKHYCSTQRIVHQAALADKMLA